ncbi:MAG: prenyltransferase [Deltaproteobacteria bacterium]|nr:prenyltransferase [Deltaproteobacteria bacterium]
MKMSAWLKAARLQLHTIGLAPLLLGNVIAWYETSRLDWTLLLLSVLAGFSVHLVTAFVNDAADVATDEHNASRTPFSGGSGVIVEGLLPRSSLLRAAGLAAVLAVVLTSGMVFILQAHWGVFLFLAAGMVSGAGYSLPPLEISYRGGGELLVTAIYSVGLVWAGYFVQAGPAQTPLLWLLSLPIGLAVFSLITITQFPDREADQRAGKRSLVILLGERRTLVAVAAAVVLSVPAAAVPLLAGAIPVRAGALSMLGLIPALVLLNMILKQERGPSLYAGLGPGTVMLTLWFAVAPAAGLIVDGLLARRGGF